jgi:hypothetical protein
MRRVRPWVLIALTPLVACHRAPQGDALADGGALAASMGSDAPMPPPPPDAPKLGAIAMKVTIHDRPTGAS